MSKRRLHLNYFLLIWCLKGAVADDQDNILDELVAKSKTPIITLLFNKDTEPLSEATKDLTPNVQALHPPHDRKAYLLYHILRTTQESETLDPEAGRKLEETENILRQSLRLRCSYFDICIQKCPPKKRYTCRLTCREEYDDYDVCNRPKKQCFTLQCGATLPPYWKMLRQRI